MLARRALVPGRTVSGLAPCLIHLPEPVPVMPRIVSVKDCCSLQGLLQPEAFQGLAGSGLPHERDGMGADGRDGPGLAMRKSSASVPAQTDSSGVNRAVPVGIGVEVLLVLCLSQMELMVELHVDRRRDRAVTRMEKLTLELPT